jgi:hypothetical protein
LDTAFTSHSGEGYDPCLLFQFDSGNEDLFEMIEEETGRRERFLKRMKSRGKWKHGKSNVEKVGRLEEARALAGPRAKT